MNAFPLVPGRRQARILEALIPGPLTTDEIAALVASDKYGSGVNRKRTRYALMCLKHRSEITWRSHVATITDEGLAALNLVKRRAA